MAQISIVVPVYNAEKYIEQTVAMVRKQTFTDWELILVEDIENRKFLKELFEAMYDELPSPRKRK